MTSILSQQKPVSSETVPERLSWRRCRRRILRSGGAELQIRATQKLDIFEYLFSRARREATDFVLILTFS